MKKDRKVIFLSTFKIFLPLLLAIVIVAVLLLNNKNKSELDLYKGVEKNTTNVIIEKIDTELSSLIGDLRILTSLDELGLYLDNPQEESHRVALEHFFINLSLHRHSYDQIRLLDKEGMEIVRVNYNNGQPVATTIDALQNKKGRYYFDEAISLEQGMIFISPLDLNVEYGEIEQPLKPMIRLATPIFDSQGVKRGVCLINYLAQNIIDQAKNISNIDIVHHIMLLNSNSYWLKCDNPDNVFGFMYPDRKNRKFSKIYPEEWQTILHSDVSQFLNKNGLFTSETVYPLRHWTQDETKKINITDKEWKVVSYIPHKALFADRVKRYRVTALIISVLTLISLYMSILIARSRYNTTIANEKLAKNEQYLKESNMTKDKFFSIIAHDLRSPFNSVLGLSSLVVSNYDKISAEKIKQYMQSINSELSKTYALLENLLSWSRSQRNAIKVNKESLNLHVLSAETIDILASAAEKKSIYLDNQVEASLHVISDPELLTTIIRNLISNAIKFTPENGSITVKAKALDPKTTKIEVIDTGRGMTKEMQGKLFKIGENVSTPGTNNENGTGLGLIVCKEFVEKLGGEIAVHSTEGQGSTFYFTISS